LVAKNINELNKTIPKTCKKSSNKTTQHERQAICGIKKKILDNHLPVTKVGKEKYTSHNA
jgi:hypothetical protein